MSATLIWRPVVSVDATLSDKLRFVLQSDGFFEGGWTNPRRISSTDVDYFAGLAAAGIEDARAIVNALCAHGVIELELMY